MLYATFIGHSYPPIPDGYSLGRKVWTRGFISGLPFLHLHFRLGITDYGEKLDVSAFLLGAPTAM